MNTFRIKPHSIQGNLYKERCHVLGKCYIDVFADDTLLNSLLAVQVLGNFQYNLSLLNLYCHHGLPRARVGPLNRKQQNLSIDFACLWDFKGLKKARVRHFSCCFNPVRMPPGDTFFPSIEKRKKYSKRNVTLQGRVCTRIGGKKALLLSGDWSSHSNCLFLTWKVPITPSFLN